MRACHSCMQEDLALPIASEAGVSPLAWGWPEVSLTQPDGIPTSKHSMTGRGQARQTILRTTLYTPKLQPVSCEVQILCRKLDGGKGKSMNINIKSIKINCSGQGEQKRWVFKRPSGLIPKHIFFSSFECVIKKMSTKSLQGLPLGFCLRRGPWSWCCKAAIQRDHKVFPATTSFIFLPVQLQFLK